MNTFLYHNELIIDIIIKFSTLFILIVTAILILWYAKETQDMKREMSDQTKYMLDSLKFEKEKIKAFVKPFFTFEDFTGTHEGKRIRIINKGKDSALDINIYGDNKRHNYTFNKSDILLVSEWAYMNIKGDIKPESKIEFFIEYFDVAGNLYKEHFIYNNNQITRI